MKNRIFATIALVALVGCGDATGLDPGDVAGTWTAQTWTFTNLANTSQTVEIISLGAAFSLTLREDSTFTATITLGADVSTDSGTYATTAATITISESGEGSPETFGVVRDGNTMTLTDNNSDFDFNVEGSDEPATEVIVFTR